MSLIGDKFREVIISVLPVAIIVLILNFTLVPLDTPMLFSFLLGSVFIVAGLTLFLIGVDIGITPLGGLIGNSLLKTNKLWVIVAAGLILGFLISIAEPSLLVLANQIELVTSGEITSVTILVVVSLGLAVMVSFGLVRIMFNIPLFKILTVLYAIVFVLAIFTTPEFLAISFDASGATTGVLAVPFILAISIGISIKKKDSKSGEKDSFGLVSIASVGAIISVMLLNIITATGSLDPVLDLNIPETTSAVEPFLSMLGPVLKESLISLLPLLVILLILQKVSFKLHRKAFIRIIKGFVYAFLGLVLFLLGVNAGFMDVGSSIGYTITSMNNNLYLIIMGFVLGVVTILAEPAVYVLTNQIEDVTSGYVKRKAVLLAISIGVGLAVALSMVRVVIYDLQLWHYLLPGYILAVGLMYVAPKLFVGIAFDAGGVATGPMITTFILAFTHGAADAKEGANILVDGFGMIAMVALAPIITLQILGLIFKIKSKKGGGSNNG
ncbi:DUF1538 domain-containing protein [Proteinivorax hydrogeniformans]|uniref:DUF1538 domain-containing protein n=1 Tax=Proteinivorax hydrogeniformans TaxID=1826727 RepID=A0AAU8HVN1_9FIRM